MCARVSLVYTCFGPGQSRGAACSRGPEGASKLTLNPLPSITAVQSNAVLALFPLLRASFGGRPHARNFPAMLLTCLQDACDVVACMWQWSGR